MSMLSWVVFPQDQLILKATQSFLDKNVEPETLMQKSVVYLQLHMNPPVGCTLNLYKRKDLSWSLETGCY